MLILHKFCDVIEVPGKGSKIEYFVKCHIKILYVLTRIQFQGHSFQNTYFLLALTVIINFQFWKIHLMFYLYYLFGSCKQNMWRVTFYQHINHILHVLKILQNFLQEFQLRMLCWGRGKGKVLENFCISTQEWYIFFCADVNECEEGTHVCSREACINEPGGYRCVPKSSDAPQCQAGFKSDHTTDTCVGM